MFNNVTHEIDLLQNIKSGIHQTTSEFCFHDILFLLLVQLFKK